MRLTQANKQKIRNRILRNAAELLRREGYDAVNLDRIMQGAGLTRGAFYAHFKSKNDLMRAVVRQEHPVLRMLQARTGQDAHALDQQMRRIFRAYLDPANIEDVFNGCTVAALTGDVARSDDPVKAAYGKAWQEILEEMARGQGLPPAAFSAAFILASGAVRTARAIRDPDLQAVTLQAASSAFDLLLPSAASGKETHAAN